MRKGIVWVNGMPRDDPKEKYNSELDRIDAAKESGDISNQDHAAITAFLNARHPDTIATNGDGETLKVGTLAAYGNNLRLVAQRAPFELTSTSSMAINQYMNDAHSGRADSAPSDGYSKSTLAQRQSALRKFYQYHDDLDVDPDNIPIFQQEDTHVDERSIFDKPDLEAMREEIDNPRDRCIFELFVNTGQRVRAIQTLRVKDVDPQEGVFFLNTDALGLKGADDHGIKRPLLGAKRAVHDWLKCHPTKDPEDALLTVRPVANRGTPGNRLNKSTISSVLRGIAKDAGVTKPANPHNFRHTFVTTAKRDYGLDNDTIKHLIGHSPDSQIMETTYAHLTDDDYIKNAEVGAKIREPESTETLTPAMCPTCNEPLADDAKACSACGNVFAPDAKAVQDRVDNDLWDGKSEADDDDTEAGIDAAREILEQNPELKQELLRELLEQEAD